MRFIPKVGGSILAMGFVFGWVCVISGCDSAGSQSTQYKPPESNILKKLGSAGHDEGDAAQAKALARTKKKR